MGLQPGKRRISLKMAVKGRGETHVSQPEESSQIYLTKLSIKVALSGVIVSAVIGLATLVVMWLKG
jgi:hypothetical protein